MANKTISLPDDVLPIIEELDMPFSVWITKQLRRYMAGRSELSFSQQLLADSALVDRPDIEQSRAALQRMERSAPW